MASAPRSPGKPTPVQVVYFPKKGKRTVSRITQTMPAVEEPVTEVDHPQVRLDEPLGSKDHGSKKKKRSKSGSSTPRVTLSDEHQAPDDGLNELAELGHQLFSQGRVVEARAIFEGLVASGPRDGFARTMLGTICLALDDQDRAMALFEEALGIDPDDLAALVYRGEIRLNRKKVRLAAEDFERAIARGHKDDPFVDRAQRLLKMAKRLAKR